MYAHKHVKTPSKHRKENNLVLKNTVLDCLKKSCGQKKIQKNPTRN